MKRFIIVFGCLLFVIALIAANGMLNSAQADDISTIADHPSHKVASGGSVVYMTTEITADAMMDIYSRLGFDLKETSDNIAVKLSTGEPPASNYLRPELVADLVQYVDGTIVECNTAYGGSRSQTAMHYQVAEDHSFTEIEDFLVMDEDGSMIIPVDGGNQLTENYVGEHFADFDGFLVLSHFKGHAMAGFGGAIKNISIGIGSREGKNLIHTAGRSHTNWTGGNQDDFLESMADAGKSVVDYLDGNILYINVMNRLSIDCDCSGRPSEPDIHDIGILASTDPVALDQACVDLIYEADNNARFINRLEGRNGEHVLEAGEQIGLGSRSYTLVSIDEETEPVELGDVNGDNKINIKDATCVQKHVAGIAMLSDRILPFADVDGDGEVTGNDTTLLQKYIVGLVPSLG